MRAAPLRLGVIGGGLGSAVGEVHRIAATMDRRWSIVAGSFSTDAVKNAATAESWGVDAERVYSDWRGLLASERESLDAVLVLTPTPSHAEIVVAALATGMNVICEKALAASAKEARSIAEAAAMHKKFLAVTYNYSGYPMLRELRSVIAQGRLGKLTQIQVEMPQEGFLRLNKQGGAMVPQAWRLVDAAVPVVSLDLGVHLHQMVHFLSGETPVEVVATQDSFGSFPQVVDNVACLIHYSGGMACQMWYGKSALGHRNGLRVRVYGTEGAAEWFQLEPETLYLNDNRGGRHVIDRGSLEAGTATEARYTRFKVGHPAGFIEAFANYYYDVADALLEFRRTGAHGSPFVFGADTAEEGLRLFEAVAQSSKLKRWESV